jgi:hypothetical protein
MPITYTHNGRQYVTLLCGIGGLWSNAAREQLKDKVRFTREAIAERAHIRELVRQARELLLQIE